MKNAVLIFLVFMMHLHSNAQEESNKMDIPVDPRTGLITFQNVISESGTKMELFNRASEWLHSYFANPVHVTKTRDAANGLIKGKHQFDLIQYDKDGNKIESGVILYDFKIEAKNGRYRYTVDNFLLKRASRYPLEKWLDKTDPSYNPKWEEYLQQVAAFINEDFVPSLEEKMKPEVVIEEEEW